MIWISKIRLKFFLHHVLRYKILAQFLIRKKSTFVCGLLLRSIFLRHCFFSNQAFFDTTPNVTDFLNIDHRLTKGNLRLNPFSYSPRKHSLACRWRLWAKQVNFILKLFFLLKTYPNSCYRHLCLRQKICFFFNVFLCAV